MPDREKVIRAFEQYVYNFIELTTTDEYNHQILEQVLVLLKEQESTTFKPHYIDKYSKHFICGVECGACHNEISSTYHYCPYCGRLLKWTGKQ